MHKNETLKHESRKEICKVYLYYSSRVQMSEAPSNGGRRVPASALESWGSIP